MKKGLISSAEERDDQEAPQHEMQEAAPVEEQEQTTGVEEAVSGEELTPQLVRSKLKLPANLQDAYGRVVLAGMKVMFDPQTHEMALNAMRGDGPIEDRLAQSIAGLMAMLYEKSNNTMPPQVIIPAGIELLVAAGDFLKKSGAEPINDQQIGDAMAGFVQLVLEQSGAADPQKLQAMLQGGVAPEEGAPQQPPAGGGLINANQEG